MSEDDFHPLEEDENIYNDINSLYNEPHLHNVFRMIIQNEYRCEIKKRYDIPWESFDKWWEIEIWDWKFLASIPYSPSLPLLEQEDTTKSQILDIFSNN